MIPGASWLDWKLGGRMLVKYPGLSVVGGITLAVAIGIGAAWFEVTQQLFEPRLQLADGDRIVRIENWDVSTSRVEPRSSHDLQIWRELSSITELGAYRSYERNLITADGNAMPAAVAEISASAFPLTRVPPLLGRTLLESDSEPGAADVVVIGYDVWQRQFNSDPGVIGRTVRLDRMPATVVGVMPSGFRFPVRQQVWLPLRLGNAAPRVGPAISVFGRLADGASLESAQAELTQIGQRMAATNAATHAQLRPLIAHYGAPSPGNRDLALLRLSNIVAWLILAVACANVATLMFARTASREGEIVVRNALGASRYRVMMQLLVEALVLCAVAAVVGLIAASFALDYGNRRIAGMEQAPFWWHFSISPATVVYTAMLAIGGAVLVGLLPAIKATGPRVQAALAQITTGSNSLRFDGVWSIMIVLQVAFAALCLPLGVAVVFWTLHQPTAPMPVPPGEYLTFRPELDRGAAGTANGRFDAAAHQARVVTVYEELKRQLENDPAVAAVTFGNGLPGMYFPLRQLEAQRGGDAPYLVDAHIEGDRVKNATVDIGFFDAFRAPLVAGRGFRAADIATGGVAIIDESLARNMGGNPLGTRIRFAASGVNEPAGRWQEVVGIVRDVGMDDPASDFVFSPASAGDDALAIIAVHVRGNAAAFGPRLRSVAMQVEPALRLYDLRPLDEVLRQRRAPDFQAMYAIVALVLIVMALSAAGLYSLMSVAVTRRTREIGIRIAIGASPRRVLNALFARAALQVGIGIVLANIFMPSLMTLLGISELQLPMVLKAMLIASLGMLLV